MRRRRPLAFAGVFVLGLVVGGVTLWRLLTGPDAADPLALAPPGSDEPGVLESSPFLEDFDLADSVIHFALAEEETAPAGTAGDPVDTVAELWFEVDGDAVPVRLAVRIFDPGGELLRAFHMDSREQTVARIDETRANAELAGSCVERGPSAPELLMQLLPFAMGDALLDADGFVEASPTINGSVPETQVHERVGEPERILSMPSWDDARQYERIQGDQEARIVVALDPDRGILMGQALVEGPGQEVVFRQAMGDIQVHERGSADHVFDLQDALDRCAELES